MNPYLQNVLLLQQGVDLLRGLDGDALAPAGAQSGVGAHFRHCIDCYRCFLDGITQHAVPAARVDYDARARAAEVEADPRVTAQVLEGLIAAFETLPHAPTQPLVVRQDAPPGVGDEEGWLQSTVGRELQFLFSHTVHHYALIALVLQQRGVAVDPSFGVAPATLVHRAASCAR